MNLKTKLIVTFAVVIAVPLFLISIVFVGFMSLQPAEVVTPQTKEFLGEMLISVILIMAMTCSFLMAWIYRSILSPIETLKKATQNIRDGNLDFEVEIEDNDEIGELCADFEEMRLRLKESVFFPELPQMNGVLTASMLISFVHSHGQHSLKISSRLILKPLKLMLKCLLQDIMEMLRKKSEEYAFS